MIHKTGWPVAALVCFLLAEFTPADAADPGVTLTPTRLRCEYRVDPLGIDALQPRVDWILQANDPSARGLKQGAYRILVASSPEILAKDQGDLWDSGQVKSGQTAQIPYAGKPLTSEAACFWKVQVWDQDGKVSGWSKAGSWSMGLLNQADWQAKWIGRDDGQPQVPNDGNKVYLPATFLRKEFTVSKPVSRAVLYVTCQGLVEPWLNGAKVGDDYFTPGWTDYHKHIYYRTYDVTSQIKPGANAWGAILGDGWYRGNVSILGQNRYGTKTRLYGQLHLIYADGSSDMIASDSSWKAAFGPILQADIQAGETYDARLEMRDWSKAGFDDSAWKAVDTNAGGTRTRDVTAKVQALIDGGHFDLDVSSMAVGDDPAFGMVKTLDVDYTVDGKPNTASGRDTETVRLKADPSNKIVVQRASYGVPDESSPTLLAYPEAPVRRQGEIVPKEITHSHSGSYVFNMGQNFSGWARLKINAPAGTKIVMRYGELKNPDGTVYRMNLRSARATDTYICKGDMDEVWEPRFTYHGFQYVEVEGLPDQPGTDTLTGIIVHSSVPPVGDFQCSDDVINRTRSNMAWTICSNSFDVPTDCPQRDERMGWMDWHEIARSALDEFDSSTLLTKWMLDIDDAQLGGGQFSQISPDAHHFGWSPCWGDSVLLIPWTMYQVYGDTRLAEKYYPDMVSNLDHYREVSPQFVGPDVGFGDWLSLEDTPKDIISTGLFGYECKAMSKMAQALGKTDDARKYQSWFEQIQAAFQQKFVHSDGTIGSNSQGGYAYAIAYDLLTDDQQQAAGHHLADVIQGKDYHISTGMPSTHLLLPALTQSGHTDVAYRMLAQQTYPSWGYFLHMGATTIWERWDSLTEKGFNADAMNSYDHANLGTCTEWFYSTLLGINTLEPGFQKIIIKPEPGGDVTWAKGHYDSIHGWIDCFWKKDDTSFTLDVTIPVNTSALVYVPASDPGRVSEGSGQAAKQPGVSFKGMDHSDAIFEIGSGTYHFTVL
jgi:alpha-L-rhamnosidase